MKNLFLVLSLLSIAGCAADGSFESYNERVERYRNEDIQKLSDNARARDSKPNEYYYKVGLSDGCNSGSKSSGDWTKPFQKDVTKYIEDKYYKSGWDDGYAQCKAQGDQINSVINGTLNGH